MALPIEKGVIPYEFDPAIRALMHDNIGYLEKLHKVAVEFVRVHYACRDQNDRNIKILATMNQLIELKIIEVQSEQKGQ